MGSKNGTLKELKSDFRGTLQGAFSNVLRDIAEGRTDINDVKDIFSALGMPKSGMQRLQRLERKMLFDSGKQSPPVEIARNQIVSANSAKYYKLSENYSGTGFSVGETIKLLGDLKLGKKPLSRIAVEEISSIKKYLERYATEPRLAYHALKYIQKNSMRLSQLLSPGGNPKLERDGSIAKIFINALPESCRGEITMDYDVYTKTGEIYDSRRISDYLKRAQFEPVDPMWALPIMQSLYNFAKQQDTPAEIKKLIKEKVKSFLESLKGSTLSIREGFGAIEDFHSSDPGWFIDWRTRKIQINLLKNFPKST